MLAFTLLAGNESFSAYADSKKGKKAGWWTKDGYVLMIW